MIGVKPGYTCPICISDRTVGTVSIAGPPEKVERYGLLVQKQAEIMLREQNFLEMKLRKEQAVRDFAQSIMIYNPENENERSLLLHGHELGYDIERCRITVVLEILSHSEGQEKLQIETLQRIRNFFPDPSHLICSLSNFQIVLFLALRCGQGGGEMEVAATVLCRELIEVLKNVGTLAVAGVGTEATNLPELALSAQSAREALRVSRAFEGLNVYSARALGTERLLASVSRRRRTRHVKQTLLNLAAADANGELAGTFLAWCENPFAPKEVAEKLFIHRNTLQYRLKKLGEIVKLDLRNFHDSFSLWVALMLERLEEHDVFERE